MSSYYSVLNHLTHPLTYAAGENKPAESLSTKQTAAAVALSTILAIPTFGIGGVASFYLTTAFFKNRNIQDLTQREVENPTRPVPNLEVDDFILIPRECPPPKMKEVHTLKPEDFVFIKRVNSGTAENETNQLSADDFHQILPSNKWNKNLVQVAIKDIKDVKSQQKLLGKAALDAMEIKSKKTEQHLNEIQTTEKNFVDNANKLANIIGRFATAFPKEEFLSKYHAYLTKVALPVFEKFQKNVEAIIAPPDTAFNKSEKMGRLYHSDDFLDYMECITDLTLLYQDYLKFGGAKRLFELNKQKPQLTADELTKLDREYSLIIFTQRGTRHDMLTHDISSKYVGEDRAIKRLNPNIKYLLNEINTSIGTRQSIDFTSNFLPSSPLKTSQFRS